MSTERERRRNREYMREYRARGGGARTTEPLVREECLARLAYIAMYKCAGTSEGCFDCTFQGWCGKK